MNIPVLGIFEDWLTPQEAFSWTSTYILRLYSRAQNSQIDSLNLHEFPELIYPLFLSHSQRVHVVLYDFHHHLLSSSIWRRIQSLTDSPCCLEARVQTCNYWLPWTPKWCPSIFLIIHPCLDLAKVLCMLALHYCLTYWLCGNLAPLESECKVQLPSCFWRWWQMQVNVLLTRREYVSEELVGP